MPPIYISSHQRKLPVLPTLTTNQKRIDLAQIKFGLFLHVYYMDVFPELLDIISYVEEALRGSSLVHKPLLCISTDCEEKAAQIRKVTDIHTFFTVCIKVFPNKGRDIGPFFASFAKEVRAVDICLKLHTKKSLATSFGSAWRQTLYTALASDAHSVLENIRHIVRDPGLGIIVPPHYHNFLQCVEIGCNHPTMQKICQRMHPHFSVSPGEWIDFPSGSMFWARTEALEPLLRCDFVCADFDADNAQKDGTIAHAIERLFLYSAVIAGYHWARIDINDIDIEKRLPMASSDHVSYVTPSVQDFYAHAVYKTSVFVDEAYYYDNYPDTVDFVGGAAAHYLAHGAAEGRFPSADYKKDIEIIEHSCDFDAIWYAMKHADVRKSPLTPAHHYLQCGWKQGYNPSLSFDTIKYLLIHDDVYKAGINPLLHYERSGREEQRGRFACTTEDVYYKDYIKFFEKHAVNLHTRKLEASMLRQRGDTRVAIFASYDKTLTIHDHVIYYLEQLNTVADRVIFIADCYYPITEIGKIAHLIDYCLCEKHGEYDFGSYKRGYFYALKNFVTDITKEIIFCNDSCFGPVFPLSVLFEDMAQISCDFWGLTSSRQFAFHLQSYFLVFKRNIFMEDFFYEYMLAITKQLSVKDVIFSYELGLTQFLLYKGYTPASYDEKMHEIDIILESNVTVHPLLGIDFKIPLVKKKALIKYFANADGIVPTLKRMREVNSALFYSVLRYLNIEEDIFINDQTVAFSIILPTYNRKYIIDRAISSVLSQSYKNFELIIVDDGSTDGTYEHIQNNYFEAISSGTIKVLKLDKNSGSSRTRNVGLDAASNEWIAYIDSDNRMKNTFLATFADSIVLNAKHKTHYAKIEYIKEKIVIGREFDYSSLEKGNFIDIGVFVHHISLYKEHGGFDKKPIGMEDWDLILRYTKNNEPYFIDRMLVEYEAGDDENRITNTAKANLIARYVQAKHHNYPKVTTIVVCYNHEMFISQAIESALMQVGDFQHQILISDDGSTDNTYKIITEYAKKYPMFITDISTAQNKGISGNYKHAFAHATGEYVAILEGDDYWSDQNKIADQIDFLRNNPDCSMVFSRIEVANAESLTKRLLARQETLPSKLNTCDFLQRTDPNLFGNFSCCMYKNELLQRLPDFIFACRFSEIPAAFFMSHFGEIGFIDKVQSVYRQHDAGVWTGASSEEQVVAAYKGRAQAWLACRERFRADLEEHMMAHFLPWVRTKAQNVDMTQLHTDMLELMKCPGGNALVQSCLYTFLQEAQEEKAHTSTCALESETCHEHGEKVYE